MEGFIFDIPATLKNVNDLDTYLLANGYTKR